MNKAIIAAAFLVGSGMATAAEPAKKEVSVLPKMDNHVACYYENIGYSKGAKITVKDETLKCVRTMIDGLRSEDNPLEWE